MSMPRCNFVDAISRSKPFATRLDRGRADLGLNPEDFEALMAALEARQSAERLIWRGRVMEIALETLAETSASRAD